MRTILTLTAAFAALHAGVTGQQIADVEFDARVSQPAFARGGPSVLLDAGHHNFHTAAGRYKPFADLIANDGFRVASGEQPFTRQQLMAYRILVVSNALHRDSAGLKEFSPPWFEAGGKPAFSDDECDVVQAWVQQGGSLLLVADHRPFGAAAASLAGRFGVDMAKGYVFDTKNTDKDGNYRTTTSNSR